MYSSTRCKKSISASKAIIEGISSDGGLYVIKEIPQIDYKSLYGKTYKEMAKVILKNLLPDYTDSELDYALSMSLIKSLKLKKLRSNYIWVLEWKASKEF